MSENLEIRHQGGRSERTKPTIGTLGKIFGICGTELTCEIGPNGEYMETARTKPTANLAGIPIRAGNARTKPAANLAVAMGYVTAKRLIDNHS
jgi:hypothetical protein